MSIRSHVIALTWSSDARIIRPMPLQQLINELLLGGAHLGLILVLAGLPLWIALSRVMVGQPRSEFW